jgi:NAD(P)-dependent dehydrogenase (short-subunit alcohol dehydrogenase family)
MSKGATNHLTTMMAADFATRNIRVRVNCIAPGPFPSEITRPWYKGELMTSADADSATGSLLPIPAARGGKCVVACIVVL